MVGEASGRMQKADYRDEIALLAAMLAWLKCGKQRTRNSRKRFLVFFCSLFVKARVVYRLLTFSSLFIYIGNSNQLRYKEIGSVQVFYKNWLQKLSLHLSISFFDIIL